MRAETITGIILFVVMCITGISDIRTKKIPLWCIICGSADAIAEMLSCGNATPEGIALDMVPGLLFILISWTTGEKVGYGDGVMIIIMGLVMHSWTCITAVMSGLFISSMFSIVMIIFRKVKIRDRIPFIPFLAVGTGVSLWMI